MWKADEVDTEGRLLQAQAGHPDSQNHGWTLEMVCSMHVISLLTGDSVMSGFLMSTKNLDLTCYIKKKKRKKEKGYSKWHMAIYSTLWHCQLVNVFLWGNYVAFCLNLSIHICVFWPETLYSVWVISFKYLIKSIFPSHTIYLFTVCNWRKRLPKM